MVTIVADGDRISSAVIRMQRHKRFGRPAACSQRSRHGIGWIALLPLFFLTFTDCRRSSQKTEGSKTITVLMWSPGEAHQLDQAIIQEFTRKTGISVRLVPGSESASQRLQQELALFRRKSNAVDVLEIDTIWPAILSDYLIDLKGALSSEVPDEIPETIESATVSARLVAAPFLVEYGMLYYRTDLLKKYGFSHPPRTWDELEAQSVRIEKGERRQGRSDFWGYVWQGADYEGLTCNALEWQRSQGGGNMLEADHTVNVDNPAAIRAFARAARWVGTISPPGTVAYLEEDSRNIWQSGRAAFLRNWSYVYRLALKSPNVKGRFAVGPMPAGVNRSSSALGGWYLGVSKNTKQRSEAIAFVRYMTSKEVQRERAIGGAFLPTFKSLYTDAAVLSANPFFRSISELPNRVFRRPAALTGAQYDRVSRIYSHGVHMILTARTSASEGAATMQTELEGLTGFPGKTSPAPSSSTEEH